MIGKNHESGVGTRLASAFACVLAFCSGASAQDSPVLKINAETERSAVTVKQIRGEVYLLEGDGGNIGVLANENGNFLVDAGISVSREKLVEALRSISTGKVSHLVNTHWHWDHSDGNPWIPGRGVRIIAHPNTARYLARTERVDDWNYTFKPLEAKGIPTELVADRRTYVVGGESIEVAALPPSHTDGDLYVHFQTSDVLFLGDTFWNGLYPFIDNEHGGSIDGMIRAVDMGLQLAGPDTIIIPGHGAVATRKELQEFRQVLGAIRNSVAELKRQGNDEEATMAAKPTAAYDEKWGGFVIDPDLFVHLVYDGL